MTPLTHRQIVMRGTPNRLEATVRPCLATKAARVKTPSVSGDTISRKWALTAHVSSDTL